MSSTTNTSPVQPRPHEPDPACDVSLSRRAGQPDRVADQGLHPKRLDDARSRPPDVAASADPGDGVAAAPTGGVAAGRCGDDGQRRGEHAPRQQLPQPASQCGAERADQVGAAVLLDRHDRVAAGACVPAEREDGHAGVHARGDDVRFVGADAKLACAGVTPPGRRARRSHRTPAGGPGRARPSVSRRAVTS